LIYLDTSVVIPFYLPEPLSLVVRELLRTEPQPALSQLVEVEVFSAVSRRVRMGEISLDQARQIATDFQTDLQNGFYTRFAVEPIHYDRARDRISQFNTALRTLDALHLAIAASNNLPLITADERLAQVADALGVTYQLLTV
jgi:uncharacterized protein